MRSLSTEKTTQLGTRDDCPSFFWIFVSPGFDDVTFICTIRLLQSSQLSFIN